MLFLLIELGSIPCYPHWFSSALTVLNVSLCHRHPGRCWGGCSLSFLPVLTEWQEPINVSINVTGNIKCVICWENLTLQELWCGPIYILQVKCGDCSAAHFRVGPLCPSDTSLTWKGRTASRNSTKRTYKIHRGSIK